MKRLLLMGLIAILIIPVTGCSDDDDNPVDPNQEIVNKLATSLHYTTRGMEYFYESEQGGFETLTGIDYRGSLGCKDCHVLPEVSDDGCGKCHTFDGTTVGAVDDTKCNGCHGRQAKEVQLGLTDVHRTAGMVCSDCHTADEVHGDGIVRNSMFEGAITTKCQNCHTESALNTGHGSLVHYTYSPGNGDLSCDACHVQATVSCYNCHFESEVQGAGKIPYGASKWKLIVKDEATGVIRAGNVQTATYDGKAVVALAPFHAHTIYVPDRATICDECHDNASVAEYNSTGEITMTTWDGATLTFTQGTIFVPDDWQTSMKWTYLTKDQIGSGGTWSEITPSAGNIVKQMLFAEPLDNMPPQF